MDEHDPTIATVSSTKQEKKYNTTVTLTGGRFRSYLEAFIILVVCIEVMATVHH